MITHILNSLILRYLDMINIDFPRVRNKIDKMCDIRNIFSN